MRILKNKYASSKIFVGLYWSGIVPYLLLIFLNCRWNTSGFVFVWNALSWYLTFSFVFLYPIECSIARRVISRHVITEPKRQLTHTSQINILGYAPLYEGAMPLEIFENSETVSFAQAVWSFVILFGVLGGPFALMIGLVFDKIKMVGLTKRKSEI